MVSHGSNLKQGFGALSLSDLLELYETRMIDADLEAEQIASPMFSMPTDKPIKNVLDEMLRHRFRRVFVSPENKSVVTDRGIINYIFSTARLTTVSKTPEALLDGKLGDLDSVEPIHISNRSLVREAALFMKGMADGCLVCDNGVLTSWDIVMKPLLNTRLSIMK